MKKAVMIMLIVTVFFAGGLIVAECSADTPEEIAPEVVTEEEAEEPEEAEAVEPEEAEEPEEEPAEEAEETGDYDPAMIIENETGLVVDRVKEFDHYNDWHAYEVEADGDLYVVTIKEWNIDVMCQIN